MTRVSSLLISAGLLIALADWIAVQKQAKRAEYVFKPAVMGCLILATIWLHPVDEARRWLFVVALVFSLGGDVFLMLKTNLFVPGLAAFLAAHIAYILGFQFGPRVGPLGSVLAAVVVVFVGISIARPILIALRFKGQRDLMKPVVAYMAAISAMVASALASGNLTASVGGALFFVSDTALATNRFVRPMRFAPLFVIVTYHLAQAGLVLSLVS